MHTGMDSPNITAKIYLQHAFAITPIKPTIGNPLFYYNAISYDHRNYKKTLDTFKISNKWSEKPVLVYGIH